MHVYILIQIIPTHFTAILAINSHLHFQYRKTISLPFIQPNLLSINPNETKSNRLPSFSDKMGPFSPKQRLRRRRFRSSHPDPNNSQQCSNETIEFSHPDTSHSAEGSSLFESAFVTNITADKPGPSLPKEYEFSSLSSVPSHQVAIDNQNLSKTSLNNSSTVLLPDKQTTPITHFSPPLVSDCEDTDSTGSSTKKERQTNLFSRFRRRNSNKSNQKEHMSSFYGSIQRLSQDNASNESTTSSGSVSRSVRGLINTFRAQRRSEQDARLNDVPELRPLNQQQQVDHLPDHMPASTLDEEGMNQHLTPPEKLGDSSYSRLSSTTHDRFTVPEKVDIPEGNVCNDGYVQFVVPPGWIAQRASDGFCLFREKAIGFIRTVKDKDAIVAVMDTARLQVIAQIAVLTSPTFVSSREATVEYVSHIGRGIGMVRLSDNLEGGAVVLGLCGPSEELNMIHKTALQLSRSAEVIQVPESSEAYVDFNAISKFDDKRQEADEIATSHNWFCAMQ